MLPRSVITWHPHIALIIFFSLGVKLKYITFGKGIVYKTFSKIKQCIVNRNPPILGDGNGNLYCFREVFK